MFDMFPFVPFPLVNKIFNRPGFKSASINKQMSFVFLVYMYELTKNVNIKASCLRTKTEMFMYNVYSICHFYTIYLILLFQDCYFFYADVMQRSSTEYSIYNSMTDFFYVCRFSFVVKFRIYLACDIYDICR